MEFPSFGDFAAYRDECDHLWPVGWPAQAGDFETTPSLSTQESVDRTAVGKWLCARENYRQAERHLERSKFVRSLTRDEDRAFARARLAIDSGCALGQYLWPELRKSAGAKSDLPGPIATREDRRRAADLARELRELMNKGIDLASEHRTRDLY